MGVAQEIMNGTVSLTNSKPKKLIIHETDCHGCGYVHYNGKTRRYTYDDGAFGDVRATVQELINIGFINAEDVLFFSEDEEEDIYNFIEERI